MKKIVTGLTAVCVAALLSGACGDTDCNQDPLTRAESCLDEGRYNAAQSLCDSLIIGDCFGRMSAEDLCRLSVLFVKLSEQANEGANYASAARSMQAAVRRNADSVEIFIENLPVDERSQTLVLRQLCNQLDFPERHTFPDDCADSVEVVLDAESLNAI